jgi:hypothetical protein
MRDVKISTAFAVIILIGALIATGPKWLVAVGMILAFVWLVYAVMRMSK